MKTLAIAPSILAADFVCLGDEIRAAEQAGADRIHIDVMDGHFVPNITMGPVIVQSIRRVTDLPFDVHLMISEPDRYLESFAAAGSDVLIPHLEACADPQRTVQLIRALGCQAGIAISPDTPVSALTVIASAVDLVLVMSVHPGFSGQPFMSSSLARVREVRALLDRVNPSASVAIDGGVDQRNVAEAAAAGADNLVAASAIFKAGVPVGEAIRRLRQSALGERPA